MRGMPPRFYERVFLSVLATAYQLAGDEKNLKRTKKKLARVK
jgi:hypothetical protein